MAKVKVKFQRLYVAGGQTYRPGRVVEVDAKLAERLEATRPPFAVRVTPQVESKAAPKAKDAAGK